MITGHQYISWLDTLIMKTHQNIVYIDVSISMLLFMLHIFTCWCTFTILRGLWQLASENGVKYLFTDTTLCSYVCYLQFLVTMSANNEIGNIL